MDVNLYYCNSYSLDDWTVVLVDGSIFVQEVFYKHIILLEICYNSHENLKYFLNSKNKMHFFVTQ